MDQLAAPPDLALAAWMAVALGVRGINCLLEDDVRTTPVTRRDFARLPPVGKTDAADILETVRNIADVGLTHGFSDSAALLDR
jgi:hypothetical protein